MKLTEEKINAAIEEIINDEGLSYTASNTIRNALEIARPRFADEYEIINSVTVGKNDIVFGVSSKDIECPYIVANAINHELFMAYENCQISNDYLEMVTYFGNRIAEESSKLSLEMELIANSDLPEISKDMLISISHDDSINNKLCVLNKSLLKPEFQKPEYQLQYVTGGFGAMGKSRGSACFTTALIDGEKTRWNRNDFIGVLKPEFYNIWVKEKLQDIEKEQIQKNNIRLIKTER